jgi:alpha-D-xyloside xylohydrolase
MNQYAVISAETSLPMMRAMWLEFPGDPSTYALDLQYMFGAEILVAPIYNSTGQRLVYFPAGRWVDYWTHEVIEGPQTRQVEASFDTLPLYIRANALIPTIEPPQFIPDTPLEFVVFDAYLLDQGSFTLRDMDGRTDLSARLAGSQLCLSVEGVKKQLGLRVFSLPDISPVESVIVNGIALPRRGQLELNRKTTPGWCRNPDGEVQIMINGV